MIAHRPTRLASHDMKLRLALVVGARGNTNKVPSWVAAGRGEI